jgi:hypothetical protein
MKPTGLQAHFQTGNWKEWENTFIQASEPLAFCSCFHIFNFWSSPQVAMISQAEPTLLHQATSLTQSSWAGWPSSAIISNLDEFAFSYHILTLWSIPPVTSLFATRLTLWLSAPVIYSKFSANKRHGSVAGPQLRPVILPSWAFIALCCHYSPSPLDIKWTLPSAEPAARWSPYSQGHHCSVLTDESASKL